MHDAAVSQVHTAALTATMRSEMRALSFFFSCALLGCTGSKSELCTRPNRACVSSCADDPMYVDACVHSRCPNGMFELAACAGDAGRPREDAGECVETPCFDPVECVRTCGGDVVYTGCCECPPGTFDRVSCDLECDEIVGQDDCSSRLCNWEPAGCEPPAGHVAGFCYDAPPVSCDRPIACPPGLVCTATWIDPCRGMTCGACGAERFVCLPPR